MSENEMPGKVYAIDGRYERIRKVGEMWISVDASNEKDKTVATVVAVDKLGKAFVIAGRAFSEGITAIRALVEMIIQLYPNKHVAWLALHHKKYKVRKKNINRILKDYEKKVSYDTKRIVTALLAEERNRG